MIKGIIFDYGGTIDSRGVHWSEVIWDGYQVAKVPVTKEQFRDSYVIAERELARVRHIMPNDNFHDLLLKKMRIELQDLANNGHLHSDDIEPLAQQVAQYCYDAARSSIEEASMDLGANRIRTFFEVTLPVLWPGITGGALLSFTLSIDDVIISYFVNGQTKTYPLRVMESIKSGVAPDVNALSALILIGTILLAVIPQSGILSKRKQ